MFDNTAVKKIIGKDEISLFSSQLSMLLKGGISLYDAMSLLSDNAKHDKRLNELYSEISKGVYEGNSFGNVLEKTGAFPSYYVKMIKIGEASGRLDEVLDSLGVYYEKSEYITNSIKSATRYPIIIILVLIAVLCVIITKVLPVFSQVYEQLGISLTGMIYGLMKFGAFLNTNGIIILIILAVVVTGAVIFSKTEKGKSFNAYIYENSRFTASLAEQSAVGRFAYALSLCISSGMNIDKAVNMSSELTPGVKQGKKINKMKALMDENESFASALSKADIFPPVYVGMIKVGVKTGNLDEAMKNVAMRYTSDTDERISRAISVIEPTLVILISVVIGLLLLAVMLPLINIMSTL